MCPQETSSRVIILSLFILVFSFAARLAECQSSEEQLVEHFRAGQEALRQGDFPRSIAEFQKVLALDPTLVEGEVNLGLAYHSVGDYALAVQYLTQALAQKPNLLTPNVIVGMDYLKLGSQQKGLPFLQRALKLDPSNREAREALASYYLGEQNFRGAAEQFKQGATLDRDKSEAWFKLGHEYLDLAARLAYRGAHLYPDSAWGHRFLGDLLFERNRWDEAAQEYRKALNIDPRQPGLHTSLGHVYLHSGKLQESEAEFRREIELDSRAELAWLGLADLALKQGQAPAGLEAVVKAWEISPEFLVLQKEFPSIELTADEARNAVIALESVSESPARHFLMASLYSLANESDRADQESKALRNELIASTKANRAQGKQDPCRSHQYSSCIRFLQKQGALTDSQRLMLGEAEFALRQYDSAAEILGKIKGVTKANAEASYWLSRTYQALGAQSYTRLEESFPDSWRTHQLRAEGLELRQDLDNAIKELQTAIQIQPDSAELHEALGNVYIEKHSDADAEKELQAALAIDSSRPRALYLLGRLYVQDGDNGKAIPNLQKALRIQPDLSEASSLLGTTYVRLGDFKDAIPYLEKAARSDHYGNVHYQLYVAYRKLGQTQLAQNALQQSQNLRRSSLEHDQALIMGSPQTDLENK